ncbi:MAG: protein kinase [Thermoanaerobaculia bacterium]|nr:protein kinase [Thermoanaerobaculia bacterium]
MDEIGKYEILEKIGVGGFGVVYKGRDPFIKRLVAVKTCSSDDEDIRRRFFREAEIAGNLHHRNVTTVYDFGVHDEVPYLVQEFLTGEDLKQFIRSGQPLLDHTKVDFLLQIAEGLQYAHDQGVVHRDIKPGNIRILESGRVKIMDFGIAKLTHAESQLTKTGMTLGTSAYLAPEQIQGEEITKAADIYAYGVVAYELLTGRRPFRGETVSSLFYQILNQEPTPVGEIWTRCPAELASIVERCLEKEPQDRYWSFSEVIDDLRPIRDRLAAASDDSSAQPTQQLEISQSVQPTVAMPSGEIREALNDLRTRVEEALEAGDPTAAEVELALARKRHPPGEEVDSEITSLEDRIRRVRRSQEQERQETERLDVLVERSRELASMGEPEEAILVLETARELHPEDTRIQRALDSLEREGTMPSSLTATESVPRRKILSRPPLWIAAGIALVGVLVAVFVLTPPETREQGAEIGETDIVAGDESAGAALQRDAPGSDRQGDGESPGEEFPGDPAPGEGAPADTTLESGERTGSLDSGAEMPQTSPSNAELEDPGPASSGREPSRSRTGDNGAPEASPASGARESEDPQERAAPGEPPAPAPEVAEARRELARGNEERALDLALAALARSPEDQEAREIANRVVDQAAETSDAAAREARSIGAADLAPATFREATARRRAGTEAAAAGSPTAAVDAYSESASLFRQAVREARAETRRREQVARERRREEARAEESRESSEPEASPSGPAPAEPEADDPREEIAEVLRRYEAAYEALDYRSVQAVYPSVPEGLARAFESFRTLELTLQGCVIEPDGDRARARCRMEQVAEFAGGGPQRENRTVEFLLERRDGRWVILERTFS